MLITSDKGYVPKGSAIRRVADATKPVSIHGRLSFLTVVYLLCMLFPMGFQAGPLALTSLRLLLIIAIIPLTIRLFSGRYGAIILTDYLFYGHIIWALIALVVNNPDRAVEQTGSVGIEFLGGYLVGRSTIRSREDFAALCKFLAFLVLLLFPFTLLETQTGNPIILSLIKKIPNINSVDLVYAGTRMGLERVQSTFAHPIHFGLFCSVVFSLTFVGLKGAIGDARRWIYSIIIGISGLLALSSGALLAIVLQLGLIFWSITFVSVKVRWWILFGLFALGYIVIDLLSNRSPIMVFLSYATFSAHTAYWRSIIFDWGLDNVLGNTARGIPSNPLFGIGLNNWIRPPYMHSGSMDNFWLVMAVRYGVPGFMLLSVGYIIAIGRIMRRDFEADQLLTNMRRAWVFTFFGLSFTLCTVHVWGNVYSFVFFIFGAGIWFITEKKTSDAYEEIVPENKFNRLKMVYSRFPPNAD